MAEVTVTQEVGAAAWVALVTTISAVVTAYAAASWYEYELMAYLRTAAQLERLRSGGAAGAQDAATGDGLV